MKLPDGSGSVEIKFTVDVSPGARSVRKPSKVAAGVTPSDLKIVISTVPLKLEFVVFNIRPVALPSPNEPALNVTAVRVRPWL